jgi:hypothetical protein
MAAKSSEESFQALREPFPKSQVGLLPRTAKRPELEYVGHGAVTARLLDVDPHWTWEPMGYGPDGQPAVDRDERGAPIGLWIKLTVLGVTRPGYGDCEPGQFSAMKVLVGDALRNAAMRFGLALDLWVRGQAEDDEKFRGDTHEPQERSLAPAPPVLSPEEQAREDHVQAVVQQAKDLKKLDNEGTGPYWKAVIEAAGATEDAKAGSAKAILTWIRQDVDAAETLLTDLVRDLKADRNQPPPEIHHEPPPEPAPKPPRAPRAKPGSAVSPEVEAASNVVKGAFPGATEE